MPNDALELAKMAIERITSVDRATKITVYDTETEVESEDKTWIVSGISPFQKEFLSNIPKVCMTVINLILYTVLCISIAQHLMGWKPG